VGHGGGMKRALDPHHRHRFPAEIISPAVWLYHTFCLSFRDVELMLAERGIEVSYETIRRWCRKFAQSFANRLRRRRSRPGDHWHLDEVFIWINGVQHYLWRAVDQDGVVLDVLVQSRRNTKVAKRFFRKQQMQWPKLGAHRLVQIRTRTLDGALRETFAAWYLGMAVNDCPTPVADDAA
jgi:transposase-like protein